MMTNNAATENAIVGDTSDGKNIFDERTFYRETDAYIESHKGKPSAILAIEINNFRFFHLWYGRELIEQTTIRGTVLNDMIAALAFYDVHDDVIEVARANEPFYRIFHFGGRAIVATNEARRKFHTLKEEQDDFRAMFEKAYSDYPRYAFGSFHFQISDKKMHWVSLRLFFLREQDGHRHYVCSFVDISSLIKASRAEEAQSERHRQNAQNGK